MGSQIGHVTSPRDGRACTSSCLDREERSRDLRSLFVTPLASPSPNIHVKLVGAKFARTLLGTATAVPTFEMLGYSWRCNLLFLSWLLTDDSVEHPAKRL